MINVNPQAGQLVSKQVTFAQGETESPALDLKGFTLVGILFGDFTGTTLQIQVSDALDGTFVAVNDTAGDPLEYIVAADGYTAIDPAPIMGINFIKLVSGTMAADDETVTLMLKGM